MPGKTQSRYQPSRIKFTTQNDPFRAVIREHGITVLIPDTGLNRQPLGPEGAARDPSPNPMPDHHMIARELLLLREMRRLRAEAERYRRISVFLLRILME